MQVQKGQRFSQRYTVSLRIFEGFVDCFNDRNPLHTDATFAQSKGFKEQVMHGNILGGFLSHFVGEGLPLKNVVIHSQEIQYKKPVYLNDELTLETEVLDVFESVNAVEFGFKFLHVSGDVLAKGKFQIGILK